MYLDFTRELSENTAVYPGDPKFERNLLSIVNEHEKSSVTLYHLHFGNHTGTHIDFPAHVLPTGKTSSDYSINDLHGPGCIIDLPLSDYSIIQKNDIVFFKSGFLNLNIAKKLVELGVSIVGTDQLSIDAPEETDLPVHHYLLARDILIVESLELTQINQGRAEFIIAPLKISSIDGVPVRVLGREV